jgi:2-haloacid dehalogenase
VARLDFRRFEALTFDCYGTLIDWERGILDALRPILGPHGVTATDDELLEAYARHEAALEAGAYLPYREILARCLHGVCGAYGVTPTGAQAREFAGSVADWPAFDDSGPALEQLSERFKLGVITNCDDDLFAHSNARLGVSFDWVVTAEQVGAYKPSTRGFELAFVRSGVPRDRILHVAQSLYHDHVPAKRLGLSTAWIDRRHGKPGAGATPAASATPDFTAVDMRSFADAALAPR